MMISKMNEVTNNLLHQLSGFHDELPLTSEVIPTGLGDLDMALDGGLKKGALYLLKGRPSSFKLSLLTDLVCKTGIEQSQNVLLFTSRDDMEKTAQEMLANVSGVPYRLVRSGLLTDQEFKSVAHATSKFDDSSISVVWDSQDITAIWQESRDLKDREGLDAIFIYYLENMEDKDALKILKELAQELDVAVFVSSRVLCEIPSLVDDKVIRDEKDVADALLILHDNSPKTEMDRVKYDVTLFICKDHAPKPAVVDLVYRPNLLRFGPV